MGDDELWKRAVAQLETEYRELDASTAEAVNQFLLVIRSLKKRIHRIVEDIDGGAVCSMCGGQCCVRGKYHVTAVDVLAFFSAGKELFTPHFADFLCPYLGECGCAMVPEFRPFNCVTFNCDRVEGLLEPANTEQFYLLEKELRRCYEAMEKLFRKRFMHGLLMNYERDVLQGGGKLLG